MWKRILKYLIGAITIVSLVIGTQIVTAETGLIVKLPKPITNIASEIGQSFTLGMVGVAYATTPDYICDGVADDVEIQAAMNALPATGGELFFFGGNYVLTATVTRAINNISIVGSGYNTYFANDGGTAIFSNGAQTGWHFENFRTDAGWLTVATACTMQNVWDNTFYVDSTVGVGAVLPTHPRTGQKYLQATTGRNWLFTYSGTAWLPEIAYGTSTLYVDSTDGTDDLTHGTGVDGNAFKTIQYAWDVIPPTYTGAVTININDETYNENLILTGKNNSEVTGYYHPTIWFIGTLTTLTTAAMDSAVQGAAAVQGSITDAGAMGAYDDKLIYANSEYRLIDSDNANTATIVGAWSALPAGNYTIYDWGTTITGAGDSLHVDFGQGQVRFQNIAFNSGSSYDVRILQQSNAIFYQCKIDAYAGTEMSSYSLFYYCLFENNVAGSYPLVGYNGLTELYMCKCKANVGVGLICFLALTNGTLLIDEGCIFDGQSGAGTYGVYAIRGGCVMFDQQASYARIRNCAVAGLYAASNSTITQTANNQYSANGANETALTDGYID